MTTTTTTPAARKTTRTRKAAAPKAPAVQVPTERTAAGYTVDLAKPGAEKERDYSKLLEKDPNSNHAEFVLWAQARLGEGVELDARTVQITLALYHTFQQSPEHKAKTQAARTAAAQKKAQADVAKMARLQKAAAQLKAMEAAAAAKADA